ncbi:response regulator [Thermoflexus sp.]|uniref:response regulator n=1 Tax=Thermoflexus sp. TaxID=1969742 RepID=UPI002ADE3378|nr:response regulator [Thermoflexus sp.]
MEKPILDGMWWDRHRLSLTQEVLNVLQQRMLDNTGVMASYRALSPLAERLIALVEGFLSGAMEIKEAQTWAREWGSQGMAISSLLSAFERIREYIRRTDPSLYVESIPLLVALEESMVCGLSEGRERYMLQEHERISRAYAVSLESSLRENQALRRRIERRLDWTLRVLQIIPRISMAQRVQEVIDNLVEGLRAHLGFPFALYHQVYAHRYQVVARESERFPESFEWDPGDSEKGELGSFRIIRCVLPAQRPWIPDFPMRHLALVLDVGPDLSEEDVEDLFKILGQAVVLSVENAFLWERTQQTLYELSVLTGQSMAERWLAPGRDAGYVFTGQGIQELREQPSGGERLSLRLGATEIGFLQIPHVDLSPDTRALLNRLVESWAILLEAASLLEQANRNARRLQAAVEIAREMVGKLDPELLISHAVESIRHHTAAIHVSVYFASDHQVLELQACDPCAEAPTHFRKLGIDEIPEVAIALAENRVVVRENFSALTTEPSIFHSAARSAVLVPILRGPGGSGGILVIEAAQPYGFDKEDVAVFELIGELLSISLESARLHQEQKQTAERLRELDRLKTQFIANMSHELRTPLNSIIGFSRVILKGIDGPLTEAQRQDITAIYNAGQHLLGLINDILDLSKIEAGRMELHFAEVDLREIIRGVMSTAVGLTRDKPIELRQEVPEDLPPVWADAQRARQVLLNLVSNAAKFTDQGFISVRAWADERFVTISVQDTGIGIPKEKQEEIFREFTQVESGTTRRHGGTGLGLAIARRLVELMGGRIWVESEVGKGSTFYFTLPRFRPLPLAEPRSSRPVVLCVDDDPGVITLYRRYLEKHGFEVVGLTDAQEVLEVVRRIRPDVITLDIMMPQKDGWVVLQELKTDPEARRIPVIICSIVDERGRGFSLGAAEYLVKPFTEEELLEAIQRVDGRPGPLRVLVIDDSEADRQLIRRVLERMGGYQVLEASGGQEGTAMAQRERPDLVILDLMMPEMDGFMVVEALKGDPATRSIPIIVLTAKSLTQEDRQRLNGRIEALLQKVGVDPEALLAEIVEVLRRPRP